MVCSRQDVEKFLAETSFEGYQTVPLPYGLRVPGRDLSKRAEAILGDRVRDRTVLDVGTYYGYFPYEAMARGAQSATGLEPNAARYDIATRIANYNGNTYDIKPGSAEELPFDNSFDTVLLLGVLHHVVDPIRVIRALAKICDETMIVEFCVAHDNQWLNNLYSDRLRPSFMRRALAKLRSWVLRVAAHDLPIIAVGSMAYNRTFFISERAFYNLFVIHHKLFESIEFHPSVVGASRTIAICKVARS